MIEWFVLAGVLWVAISIVVGMLFGAVAKDPELFADDEWGRPDRIDQRRD